MNSQKKMEGKTLYVLSLSGGRYYVGVCDNLKEELDRQKNLLGCRWVSMYGPGNLVESRPLRFGLELDLTVKQYMMKHGVENVRGGSYNQIDLPAIARNFLQRELLTAENKCWKCGKLHEGKCTQEECRKCGRMHPTDRCFSLYDVMGKRINELCDRCGREHHIDTCSAKTHISGYSLPPYNCRRCGSKTHVTANCFVENKNPASSELALSNHNEGLSIEYCLSLLPSISMVIVFLLVLPLFLSLIY